MGAYIGSGSRRAGSRPTSLSQDVNHPYLSQLATKPSQAAILLRFHCDVSEAPTHRNEIVDYDVLVASCDVSEAPTHRNEIV